MKLFNAKAFMVAGSLLSALAWMGSCTKKPKQESQALGLEQGRKIFYHYRTTEEKTLDPHKQFDQASALLVRSLYDTLLEYHYLKRPYNLEPALLEKLPEKQKGASYLFTLRKGVKFNDSPAFPGGKGRELNSDDVIFSLKRFADARVNDRSYSLIAGRILGIDEFRAKTKKLGKELGYDKLSIPGVKKLDQYQFTIEFTKDSHLNLFPLASSAMSILPQEAIQKFGDDIDKNPVGTGPYSMKSYSRRGTTVLAKNPNYWGSYPTDGESGDQERGLLVNAGKKLPFIDEIHLPLIEESQPAMLKFKKKELHWVAVNRDDFQAMIASLPNKQFKLLAPYDKDFVLNSAPSLSSSYLKFSFPDPLVGKNKALRQAIAAALDYEGYINLMLNGRAYAAQSIVPREISGSARDTNSTWYKTDIAFAKKKLSEAGFPDGKGLPELAIEYRSVDKNVRQLFEYIRNDLSKIGINVKGNFQTFSNFIQKTEAGNFQIADAGWGADYPDPENFYALLYGPNKAPLPNDGNFQNARYDELFMKMKDMDAGPERTKIIQEMDSIIKEEVPYILLFNPIMVSLTQQNVLNMKRSMMEENPYKFLDLAGK